MELIELVQKPGAVVVDVREPWEFFLGHVPHSINIPLGSVPAQLQRFREMTGPILLICASGNRSGQAAHFLQSQGLSQAFNAGGWREFKSAVAKAA